MRELLLAATARRRDEWDRTAALIAEIRNLVRDPKKKPRPWTAAEINPLADRESNRKAAPTPGGMEALRILCTNGKLKP